MRDLLLVLVSAGFCMVALRRPVYGFLAFLCLSILNPHSMAWGFAQSLPLSQYVAIATLIGFALSPESKRITITRETILMAVLWGHFCVTTIFAIDPDRAVDVLIQISKVLLMVFLSLILISTNDLLRAMLRIIALSIGFYGLKGGIFFIVSGGNYMVWGPEQSYLAGNNAIGLAMAMNIPLLYFLARLETSMWMKRLMQVALVFSIVAVIGTYSRGAWVGMVAGLGMCLLRTPRKYIIGLVLGLVLMVSAPLAILYMPQKLVDRYDTLAEYEKDGSAQSRFHSWQFCANVGMDHPILGGGFDFFSLEAYAIYYPEMLDLYPGKVWSCHSNWFSLFAEHGFPGLLLWTALLMSCLASANRIRAFGKKHASYSWLCEYANLIEGAFVVFIVSGSFVDKVYFDVFYQLVAVIILSKRVMERAIKEMTIKNQKKIAAARVVFS